MSEMLCSTHSGTKPTTEIHWSDPVTITIPYEEALALAECTGFSKTFYIGGGHPLHAAALKALEEQYDYISPD